MDVKPAPGLKIRDPYTKQFISDSGHTVSADDLYWARRLKDGDVVLVNAGNVENAVVGAVDTANTKASDGSKK